MDTKRKIMESLGTQQTGYADWAKTVLLNYPYNPTFKKRGDVVDVFYQEEKIGEYNFGKGTGRVFLNDKKYSLKEVGKLDNYQEFDLDTFIET